MEYSYRALECFGKVIYRICERRGESDAWRKVLGTIDYNREEEAKRKVGELVRAREGKKTC